VTDRGDVSQLLETIGTLERRLAALQDERRLAAEAEAALRHGGQMLDAIVRAAPIGLGLVKDRVFVWVNDFLCAMLGYAAEDLVGRSARMVYPSDEEFDRVGRVKYAQIAECGLGVAETTWVCKDGRRMDILLSSVMAVPGDRSRGTVFTALDVTRRQRAERERADLEAQLRQSQKMESIGRLAGGIAHDFNNLLTPILGYADLNLLRMTPDDPSYEDLSAIREAANSARELTCQLLAFGRKQVLEMRLVELNEAIGSIRNLLRRVVREDISLTVRLDETEGLSVKADVTQLHQVILNLVNNACQAMPRGGELSLTSARARLDDVGSRVAPGLRPGEYAVVAVTDTGEGMAPDVVERICEPFFTTRAEGQGTGLGLSMVYGLVQQHGGYVTVSSVPGVGTTFKVFLPVVTPEPAFAPLVIDRATAAREGETILVVDDERIIRELTVTVLTNAGYRVFEAGDANEALSIVDHARTRVSLLLVDVVMPDTDGVALAERVRQMSPDTRILYMSGYTDGVLERHGLHDYDVNLLTKPFSANTLLAKARELLDGTQRPQADGPAA